MADTNFDVIIHRLGTGRLRDRHPRGPARLQDRDYRARLSRRHLPELGCIPTKALLRSAEIYHHMQHAKDFGLKADNVGFDAAAVVKRSRGVAAAWPPALRSS